MTPFNSIHKTASFTGHKDCVYSLAPAKDEHTFYSAAGDGMVVQWNIHRPDEGELFAKVPNSIYAMCFWKERDLLIVGQNFEGLHFIDVDSKKEVASIKMTSAYIFDIQLFNNRIYVACGDGEVAVIDPDTMTKTASIRLSDKSARCIAINPLVNEMAVGYSDTVVRILSLKDLSLVQEIREHRISVFTLRYTPDFKFLLSSGRDATICSWDCWNHYSLYHKVVAHMYAVNHIDFSPDGKLFASASMDKSIKIWNAENMQLLKVLDKSRHAGHATSVNKLLWLPASGYLISCSDDRTISGWKFE